MGTNNCTSAAESGEPSTKSKLISVGIELFSEHGYEATTTRMIAEAAGVNNAAVFFHFGSKENYYAEVLNTVAENMQITYQPLRQELSVARLDGPLSPVSAWHFIEKYIDLFIHILQDPSNNNVLYLLLHEQLNPVNGHRPITRVACQQGEQILCQLLLEYWRIKDENAARIASRMATSALVAQAEHPSFIRITLGLGENDELPESAWRDIRRFTLAGLRNFSPLFPDEII